MFETINSTNKAEVTLSLKEVLMVETIVGGEPLANSKDIVEPSFSHTVFKGPLPYIF